MSTEYILLYGPNTTDIETYANNVKETEIGGEYMGSPVIDKPGPKTLRLCFDRGPENCYACVHSGWAKIKDCKAPITSGGDIKKPDIKK